MKRIDGRDVLMLVLCVTSGMLGYVDGKYSGMRDDRIEVRPLRESDLQPPIQWDVPIPPAKRRVDGRPDHPQATPPSEVEPLFLDPPKQEPPPSWLT